MNIKQAHKEFQLFLDKVDSQALPDFLPQEVDTLIHEAELRLINQAYGRNNIYQKGFQEIQKRTDDLNALVKRGTISSDNNLFRLADITRDGVFTKDYLYYLGCRVLIEGIWITPKLVQLDDISKLLKDPYNKPTKARPLIVFLDNSIEVYTDDIFVIDTIEVTYLKYPKRVDYTLDISSELPEHKQREALQLAVRIALGTIESPRTPDQDAQLGRLE